MQLCPTCVAPIMLLFKYPSQLSELDGVYLVESPKVEPLRHFVTEWDREKQVKFIEIRMHHYFPFPT